MKQGTDYKNFFTEDGKTRLLSGAELVEKELQVLLQFQKHSLFFGNGIGLDAEKYLHLSNREATFNLIKREIEELFSKYSKAYLQNITMYFNEQKNSIEITLDVITNTIGRSEILQIPFTIE